MSFVPVRHISFFATFGGRLTALRRDEVTPAYLSAKEVAASEFSMPS